MANRNGRSRRSARAAAPMSSGGGNAPPARAHRPDRHGPQDGEAGRNPDRRLPGDVAESAHQVRRPRAEGQRAYDHAGRHAASALEVRGDQPHRRGVDSGERDADQKTDRQSEREAVGHQQPYVRRRLPRPQIRRSASRACSRSGRLSTAPPDAADHEADLNDDDQPRGAGRRQVPVVLESRHDRRRAEPGRIGQHGREGHEDESLRRRSMVGHVRKLDLVVCSLAPYVTDESDNVVRDQPPMASLE